MELQSHIYNYFCYKIHPKAHPVQFDLSLLKETFKDIFLSSIGLTHENKTVFETQFKINFQIQKISFLRNFTLVDAEFTRFEQNGIISQIKYSDWAIPIVVVRKKNGMIRICADYSIGTQ